MSVDCPHWTDCGVRKGGCCSKGLYGGKPSVATCAICTDRGDRGAGDVVARVLAKTGVAPLVSSVIEKVTGKKCDCITRQAKLNKMLPLRPH